ncbi:hypothetical protein MKEN_00633400 [Mycena kentingensis (nom. inval.)]|nr:hypothetical protein MKEN_00633400 [Mycena kentingensis (nom. inval.)]
MQNSALATPLTAGGSLFNETEAPSDGKQTKRDRVPSVSEAVLEPKRPRLGPGPEHFEEILPGTTGNHISEHR